MGSYVSPSYEARVEAALAAASPTSTNPGLFAPDGTSLLVSAGVASVATQAIGTLAPAPAWTDSTILSVSNDGNTLLKGTASQIVTYLNAKNPVSAALLGTDSTGKIIVGSASGVSRSISGFASPSWYNQGGASVLNANGTLYLTLPTNGASDNWRAQTIALPTSPYTIDILLDMRLPAANFYAGGLILGNSGGGFFFGGVAAVAYDAINDRPGFFACTASGPTAAATQVGTTLPITSATGLLFARVTNDGSNMSVGMSHSGRSFHTMHTGPVTDFLTPGYIGFGGNANDNHTLNASLVIGMLDYYETSSVLAMTTPTIRPLV